MITLYDDETSADCYQVRIALSLLGLEQREIALDEYVPDDPDAFRPPVVLLDGRTDPPAVLHDNTAALLHLCRTYDTSGDLLGGADPARQAQVLDWLSVSRRLSQTAGAARRYESFGEVVTDVASARQEAERILEVMDRHLWFGEQEGRDFLVDTFTIADVACFGDVVLSEEGGISREDYPAVRRWCDRVKRFPDVPLMSGIFPAAPGRTA